MQSTDRPDAGRASFADGNERVGYVVQTPQVRHFREHPIAKRELPHVCEDHRPVRVGSQLGGRRVDANP